MIRKIATTTLFITLSLLLLLLATVTLRANGGVFGINWWTTESGAVASGSGEQGSYSLSGTLGQPDAGNQAGGTFQLSGGYWSGSTKADFSVFLPLIVREGS